MKQRKTCWEFGGEELQDLRKKSERTFRAVRSGPVALYLRDSPFTWDLKSAAIFMFKHHAPHEVSSLCCACSNCMLYCHSGLGGTADDAADISLNRFCSA